MLEKISWSQYWATMAIANLTYYFIVVCCLYRKNIAWLTGKRWLRIQHTAPSPGFVDFMGAAKETPSEERALHTENEKAAPFNTKNMQVLEGAEKVAELVGKALSELGTSARAPQIIAAISSVIEQNNMDHSLTPFREAIDWHIVQTAIDSCGVILEDREVDAIWQSEK